MFKKHKQTVITTVIPDRFADRRNLIRNLWNILSLRARTKPFGCAQGKLRGVRLLCFKRSNLNAKTVISFFMQRFFGRPPEAGRRDLRRPQNDSRLRMTMGLKISRITALFRNRNIATTVCVLALFLLIIPEVASAQSMNDTMGPWIKEAQTAITFVMLYINKMLWVILVIVGPLLDNKILFSSCVDAADPCKTMEDNLLGIWMQIRNIVNIVFVVILVFTALYNVIGKTEGEFVLKTMLPKIIIGLIAVNFSFLASKVILDAANVATTAVAAIPVNVNPELQDFETFKGSLGTKLCNYTDDTGKAAQPLKADQIKEWGLEGICTTAGEFAADFQTGFLSKFTHTNLAFIMTVEIANLSKFKFISTKLENDSALAVLDTVLNFLLDIAVNVGIILLYTVAVLALLAVAAMRIVVLWLMIALSPLVVLFIIIPQLGKGLGDTDLKSTFIQHAIAPIIMVGALSIGFVFLESMTNDITVGGDGFQLGEKALHDTIDAVSKGNFEGMHLGDLLALIAGVMVIWTGVFGAASKTYANFITEKLNSWTKSGATFLAKLPLYATPIPITTKGGGHKEIPLAHALSGAGTMWQGMTDKMGGRAAAKKSFEGTAFEKFFGEDKGAAISEFQKSKNYTDVKKTLPAMVGVGLVTSDWEKRAKEIEEIAKTDTENAPRLKQIVEAIRQSNGDEDTIIEKIKAFDPELATAMETAKGKAAERAEDEKTIAEPKTAREMVALAKEQNLKPENIQDAQAKQLAQSITALPAGVVAVIDQQATTLGKSTDDAFFAAAVDAATSKKTTDGKAKDYLDGITDSAQRTQAETALQEVIKKATPAPSGGSSS